MMEKHHLPIKSVCKIGQKIDNSVRVPILRSFCAGFYINTAKKHGGRPFFFPYLSSISTGNSTDMISLFISPQSSLFNIDPDRLEWVIYNDV